MVKECLQTQIVVIGFVAMETLKFHAAAAAAQHYSIFPLDFAEICRNEK